MNSYLFYCVRYFDKTCPDPHLSIKDYFSKYSDALDDFESLRSDPDRYIKPCIFEIREVSPYIPVFAGDPDSDNSCKIGSNVEFDNLIAYQ